MVATACGTIGCGLTDGGVVDESPLHAARVIVDAARMVHMRKRRMRMNTSGDALESTGRAKQPSRGSRSGERSHDVDRSLYIVDVGWNAD
jgi:hypothetical protein